MSDIAMNAELCRLLDNRWEVVMHRQVDGQYMAAARRAWKESWKDVFETVDDDGKPASFLDRSNGYHHRMPHRIASAGTPVEALQLLASKIFGMQPVEESDHA